MNNRLILRSLTSPFPSPYNDTTKGSVLSHDDVDNNFIYLKGQTFFSAETEGQNVILHKLNGETFTFPTATGLTIWDNGSGLFSIKAVNDSGTDAIGNYSLAEGSGTIASGFTSHAEGENTLAQGYASHTEGGSTTAIGFYSHAEGQGTIAIGDYSHSSGQNTQALGVQSHTEGLTTTSTGQAAHAEGLTTFANGQAAHSEGRQTIASGNTTHAEGRQTTAIGTSAHAEGNRTIAIGNNSHAEGNTTTASGTSAHSEGSNTQALGNISHAEGNITLAIGDYSHSEGAQTTAIGQTSHAGGASTIAFGNYSFVHGSGSTANGLSTIVLGSGLTGNTDNTVYVPYLNINNLASGTSINNLGIDASGNIVSANTTTSSGAFWPLSGTSSGQTASGYIQVDASVDSDHPIIWKNSNLGIGNGLAFSFSDNSFLHAANLQSTITLDGNGVNIVGVNSDAFQFAGISALNAFGVQFQVSTTGISDAIVVSLSNQDGSYTISAGNNPSFSGMQYEALDNTAQFVANNATDSSIMHRGYNDLRYLSSATTFTDVHVTGGTYTAGTATFTNNTGGTFSVSGFSTGSSSVNSYKLTTGLTANVTSTIHHNLNDLDIIVQIKDLTNNELITLAIDNYQLNTIDVTSNINITSARIMILGI